MAATIVNGIKLAAYVEQGMTGEVSIRRASPSGTSATGQHKFDSSEQYTQVMGGDDRLTRTISRSSKRQFPSSRRRTLRNAFQHRMFHRALFVPDKVEIHPHGKYVWDVGFAYLAVAVK